MCTKVKGIFVPGTISFLTAALLIISAQTKYKEMLESLYEHLLLFSGIFFMLLYITIGNTRLIKKQDFLVSLIVFITMVAIEIIFFNLPETTKVMIVSIFTFLMTKTLLRMLNAIKNMSDAEKKHKKEVEDWASHKNISSEVLNAVNNAIEGKGVKPYFQPIYDNNAKTFNKFEALMRIQHNDKIFAPAVFMDYIKKSEQYLIISEKMIQEVFDIFRNIEATVSINISSGDIMDANISSMILHNLKKPRKNKVILELLETEKIEDIERVNDFFKEAKQLGALIAIDDYGAGYSNINIIAQIKPDIIKIDGDIIRSLPDNPMMISAINSVVDMAKVINAEVVAEYVENENIQKIIEEKGVQYSQGYYYSQPVPFEDISKYIK